MAFSSGPRIAAALAVALALGGPDAAAALDIGPRSVTLTVAGVPIQIPVAASLDVRTTPDAVDLSATATGDLRAIQDHALAIARGLRLPHEPCAHKGLNIVVDSLDSAKITPVEATAVIELSGRVTLWLCRKILGASVKAEIASDAVRISAPVELFTPGPQAVALRLAGPARLETGDALTTDAARALVGDIDAALTVQLGKLLDSSRARASVPPLPGLEATIESATFARDGERLTVRATGRATMTSAAFTRFLAFVGH